VARELEWDAYLLRAASVYEEACGHHTVTQAGYYQSSSGANLGSLRGPHGGYLAGTNGDWSDSPPAFCT
jgi:hypothetical protein